MPELNLKFAKVLSVFIFVFSCWGMKAHADDTGLRFQSFDPYFPSQQLLDDPRFGFKQDGGKDVPWYVQKSDQLNSIFNAGDMIGQVRNWNLLQKHLLIRRLDEHGAKEVAVLYKQFSLTQLGNAEVVLRKIKGDAP